MNKDQFFQRAVEITKAHGFDILGNQVKDLIAENEQLKKDVFGFAEWVVSEGWEHYDGHDRWINQRQNDKVVETHQLYKLFKNEK